MTSYFNPGRFQRRVENYRRFRAALPPDVPLVAVEGSRDGTFTLTDADADVVIRVSGAALWQKERLLNLGIQATPTTIEAVAWMDCDVILQDTDWVEQTLAALRDVPVVQPFAKVDWLGPDDGATPGASWPSLVREHLDGALSDEVCRVWQRTSSPEVPIGDGYAWAARRDLVARHELYDACVVGGGTRSFALAALDRVEPLLAAQWLNSAQRAHMASWARPFAAEVEGGVGSLPGTIHHLWHGSIANRSYGVRDVELAAYGFDPYEDIVLNEEGCWAWTRPDSPMAQWVSAYFDNRREDNRSDLEAVSPDRP